MNDNSLYTKDAEQLINFFQDFPDKVALASSEGNLVSFCMSTLSVKSFDNKEIDSAVADLMSIILMIQKNIKPELAQQVNEVVQVRVNAMHEWLKCVHDRIIEPSDVDYLLGDGVNINDVKNNSNTKILMNDYFHLMTPDTVGFNSNIQVIDEMEKDDAEESGTDWLALINVPVQGIADKSLVLAPNPIDVLDRKIIWVGRESWLKNLLATKTRLKRHKQVIKALSYLYEQVGEELLYRNVSIEDTVFNSTKFKYSKGTKDDVHFILEGSDGS